MSPRVLYRSLLTRLHTHAPALGAWGCARLALLVTGLVVARKATVPRIAAGARWASPDTTVESVERRVRRALGDRRIDDPDAFAALAEAALARLPAGRVWVLLDDSAQDARCHLTMLALAYRGRALPLAWVRWQGRLARGQYWQQVEAVIAQAVQILPARLRPCLLADRGISSPRLVALAEAAGWDYLLRVQGSVVLRQQDGSRCALATLAPAPGTGFALSGHLFTQRPLTAGAVGAWEAGHQAPWLLVTNLPPVRSLVAAYAQRMQIEALFHDMKSAGFDWEASRVMDPDRAARLLAVILIAVLVATLLGEADERSDPHPPRGRRADRPVRSLLARGLASLHAPPRFRRLPTSFLPTPSKTVRV
jgi:hypothetical protein